MIFWLGLALGILIGTVVGVAVMGILLAGKLSDMQAQIDAWEATRWSSLEGPQ